jgi:hypothetical protein
MPAFTETPVAYSTTDGRRMTTRELAERAQFYLDMEIWVRENPIDRAVQPNASNLVNWLHAHRRTLTKLLAKMEESRPC